MLVISYYKIKMFFFYKNLKMFKIFNTKESQNRKLLKSDVDCDNVKSTERKCLFLLIF